MAKMIICSECGEEKAHCARRMCKSCYNAWYLQEHKEERRIYNKQWLQENPGKMSLYNRRNYEKHREKRLTWQKQYRQDNPEKVKKSKRRYQVAHRKEYNLYKSDWRQENPGKVAAQYARRQARKRSLPSTLSGEEIERKLSIGRCFYCGKETNLGLDHFVPLSARSNIACGTTLANSVAACKSCNSSKNNRMPEEILAQLSFIEAQSEPLDSRALE